MFRTVFILPLVFVYRHTCSAEFTDDYCWRDYDGVVPKDAFKAGTARDGTGIYIGQTPHDNKLIPGKIHENASEIHIEFHEVHVLNEAIKILCTQTPSKFEWVKTHTDEVLNMKDKHIFQGGYEKGYTTYVGRALSHGELTVGKVVCSSGECYHLTTIENGTWYKHDEFEILTYNPDALPNVISSISPSRTVTAIENEIQYDRREIENITYNPNAIPDAISTVSPSATALSSLPGFWAYFFLVVTQALLR